MKTTVNAARVGRLLGITRQAVSKGLAENSGELRPEWRVTLQEMATRKGYPDVAALLADDATRPWEPARPWADVGDSFQREALQWRDALAGPLARQHERPPGEIMAEAVAEARRVFGRDVSEATVRRHFDLACERDRGFQQWARPDIYLSEASQAARPVAPGRAPVAVAALTPAFEAVTRPEAPTAQEKAEVWRALVTFDGGPKAALAYAQKAVPGLVRGGPAAWRRAYSRKAAAWAQEGAAGLTTDCSRCGRKARSLCPRCLDLVKGATVEHDENLPLAWRRLILPPDLGGIRADGKGLCDTCAGLWHYDVRTNKSYVPPAVRRLVMPDAKAAQVWRHGPHRARQASPYVARDPADIGPGDIFEADDITWPNYFWTTDAQGRPFACMAECLLLIDRRSWYPLAYRLIPAELGEDGRKVEKASYNGLDVRRLILRGHDQWGLPHRQFVFENGVWRSRLVAGVSGRHWLDPDFAGLERGLNEQGILLGPGAVHHAAPGNGRSKLIERMNKSVQERLRPHPGFAGFNQREYNNEALTKFLRQVKAGKVHPQEHLLSLEEFGKLLDVELMGYAKEPQNGAWLRDSDGRGVSPLEALINGICGRPGIAELPLRKLPAEKHYLLATHAREVEVKGNGIVFEVGGRRLVFWGKRLVAYQHRKLPVRWNLEEPDLLHVLPPGAEPFTLRRRELPSSTATPAQLAATGKDRRAWVNHGKAIHDNLPHPLRTSITRDGEVTPEHQRTAAAVAAGEAEERARKLEAKRQRARAGALKLPAEQAEKLSPKTLDRMVEAKRDLERFFSGGTE